MIETNILRQSLPVFLSEGAFLRHPDGTCTVAVGPAKALKAQENSDFTWFTMEFFAPEPQRTVFAQVVKISQTEMSQVLAEYLGDSRPQLPTSSQQPKLEDFKQDMHSIMDKIQSGQIAKAVPIVEESWDYAPDDTMKAYLIWRALQSPSHLYPYGFWSNSQGFIGVTPEKLIQARGHKSFSTVALAGTLAKTQQHDGGSLLTDKKELSEHQKVIADIFHQLSPFGKVEIGGTEIVELPKLYHLKTDIQLATHKEVPIEELIMAMHPTAALGVYPRSGNNHWYRQLNYQMGREYFGAPFGFQAKDGTALILVSIRNLCWNRAKTFLRVGCGVVADSLVQNEWNELAKKREATLFQLGLL